MHKHAAECDRLDRLRQWLQECPWDEIERLSGLDETWLGSVHAALETLWTALGTSERWMWQQKESPSVCRMARLFSRASWKQLKREINSGITLCRIGQQLQREIRQRDQVEMVLKESESRYRNLVENSLGFICTHDLDGVLLSVNPAAAHCLGYEPHQGIGRNLREFLTPSTRHLFDDYLRRLRRRHMAEGLMRLVTASGEERIWCYRNVLVEEDGKSPYVLGNAHDISERVQSEIALRDSESRFRILVESSSQGIGIHRNFKPLFVNQAYVDTFGYANPEEILRLDTSLILVAPHDRGKIRQYHHARNRGEASPERYEVQGVRKDGALIWLEVFVSVVNWEGEPASLLVFVDITERKRTEEALYRSERQYRELARSLQRRQEDERRYIVREIHDELGQRLTSLNIDIFWLSRCQTALPPGWRERLADMSLQIKSVIASIQRIGTAMRPEMLDDLGLVAAIQWQLQEVQQRTCLTYMLDLASDDVVLDPDRATAVFRIFQEGLTNVVRHAEASCVTVRLIQQPDELRLEICDDGVGISPENLEDRTSLGLTSMQERARMWGGDLTIQGEPGGGTTVALRLPL